MGQSNSKVLGEADLKRFIGTFQMVRRETGSGLTYCLDQSTGREIAIKEIKVGSNYESQALCEMVQSKMAMQHENLVNYVDYFIYKPQVCSGSDLKVLVVCDYPFKSLKQEIDERVLGRDQFSEPELYSILYSCVKGLEFLVDAHIDYDAISSRNILLDKEGRIKLNDPWLNASDASEAFVCRDDLLNRYLPPQLTAANVQVSSVEGLQRANVYSLAIVLLECAFLRSLDELDTTAIEKSREVNKLLKNLDKDKDLSPKTRLLLRRMLDDHPNNRISYEDIIQYIEEEKEGLLHISEVEEELEVTKPEDNEHESSGKSPKADDKPLAFNCNMLSPKQKPTIQIKKVQASGSTQSPGGLTNQFLKPSFTNFGFGTTGLGTTSLKPFDIGSGFNSGLINSFGTSLGNGFGSTNLGLGMGATSNIGNPFTANRWSVTGINSWAPTSADPISARNTVPSQPVRKLEYDRESIGSSGKPPVRDERPPPSKVSPTAPFQPPHTQSPIKNKDNSIQLEQVYRQYDDGSIYQGQELEGKRHGYGRMIYPGGREYIGNWIAGAIQGEGKLFNSKKELIFEGMWKRNTKEGNGRDYNEQSKILQQTFDYRNLTKVGSYWNKYEGNFRNNKRHGKGKLTLTNNEIFEGEFQDDIPEGKGTYQTLHKGPISGVWKKGVLLY